MHDTRTTEGRLFDETEEPHIVVTVQGGVDLESKVDLGSISHFRS